MPKISSPLSRRSALKGMALAASASSLPISLLSSPINAANHKDAALFLSLSSLLTGIKLDASYLQLGQDILFLLGLNYQFNLQYDNLVLSFEENNSEAQEQASYLAKHHPYPVQVILKAWYLSQVSLSEKDKQNPLVQKLCPNLRQEKENYRMAGQGRDSQLQTVIGQINYDEALTWMACSFTKPSATCGGPFGYWKEAPTPV